MKCANTRCSYRSGDICEECNETEYLQGSITSFVSCPNHIPINKKEEYVYTGTAIPIDPHTQATTAMSIDSHIQAIQKKNEEIYNKEVEIKLLQDNIAVYKMEIATLHQELKQQAKDASYLIENRNQEIKTLKEELLNLKNKPINAHDRMEI